MLQEIRTSGQTTDVQLLPSANARGPQFELLGGKRTFYEVSQGKNYQEREEDFDFSG